MTASAQFTSGSSSTFSSPNGYTYLRAGFAPTTTKYVGDYEYEDDNGSTFSLGFGHAFTIQSLPVLFEAGADIEWYTLKDSDTELGITGSVNRNTLGLRIPLNVVLPLNFSSLSLYPYVGLNAKGYFFSQDSYKVEYKDTEEKHTVNLLDKDDVKLAYGDPWKRFTFGYQLGVRARLSDFILSLGYLGDFDKVFQDGKQGMFTIGVGFAL